MLYMAFRKINQRADDRNSGSAHPGTGMESVEPSFNGVMLLHMKNGEKEYISRKFVPQLKKYLGL